LEKRSIRPVSAASASAEKIVCESPRPHVIQDGDVTPVSALPHDEDLAGFIKSGHNAILFNVHDLAVSIEIQFLEDPLDGFTDSWEFLDETFGPIGK